MLSPKCSHCKPEKSLPPGCAYLFNMISGGWESQYQLCAQQTDLNYFQSVAEGEDGLLEH